MIKPFKGTYKLNQAFNDPCCRQQYAQFGLKGHNGLDYGLPNGTPLIAPHAGKIYVGYESGGYGNYIFVTGSKYESIVGHLQKAVVKTGQTVREGQLIGYSDNTGFSSGAHLHWGVRPVNYNRNNGFLGYINPLPLLKKMITKDQLNHLFRFYLGQPPTEAQQAAYVGKRTWETSKRLIKDSQTYDKRIAQAKAGTLNCNKHLPSELRV